MKLVACPTCRAQFDVADVADESVGCPCGATFPARPPTAVDAAVTRCAACGALVGDTERSCSYCQATVARHPAPAGPVCPECYARNPEQARHCTACGISFLPQPVRRSSDPRGCPVCPGVHLAARSLGGLWVDECPMCLGLWAPGDVMDRLVDRARERRRRAGEPVAGPQGERRSAWQAKFTYRRCPECAGPMRRKNFGHRSGVIVDWCGSHGTWLDAHEMEDVAAFVLEGGLEISATPEKDGGWTLPADPARTAALLAAEQLMAEERAQAQARNRPGPLGTGRVLHGIGDLIAEFLK